MATRIYVGDLSSAATDQDLFALFHSCGAVTEAAVAVDQKSGQRCGFGYVQMPDDRAARAAIAGMDGHQLDHRRCVSASPIHASAPRPLDNAQRSKACERAIRLRCLLAAKRATAPLRAPTFDAQMDV
jgi:hypothetical protein